MTALDSWHWVQVEVSLENPAATWDDSGPGLQEGQEVEDNDINCEQLVQQESWQDKDKVRAGSGDQPGHPLVTLPSLGLPKSGIHSFCSH